MRTERKRDGLLSSRFRFRVNMDLRCMEARPKNADASGKSVPNQCSPFGAASGHWTATSFGKRLLAGDPHKLARMLDLSQDDPPGTQDLRAAFRRQLTAPMKQTVCAVAGRGTGASGDEVSEFTLAALLCSPAPHLECLGACKDYAKACLQHPDPRFPQEIARVIYFACIAAALLRCHQRITRLEDNALLEAFKWCLGQDWCLEELSPLFHEGIDHLKAQVAV